MSTTARRKADRADVRIHSPYTFQQIARSEPTDKTKSNYNLLWAVFPIKRNDSKTRIIYISGISKRRL